MKKLAYLAPLLRFILISLLITTISRFVLFLIFKDRVIQTEHFWYLFPIGLRMDLILVSYLSFIPAILLSLSPSSILKYISKFLVVYFSLFVLLIFFIELATLDFIKEYDTRPNRLFLDYLIYPKEVASMLMKSHTLSIVMVVLLLAGAIFVLWKYGKRLFGIRNTPYTYRLLLFPLVGFLLFWGARSSLTSRRPINASNAIFSTDQLTNNLGLNSFYTVMFAAYSMKNEEDASKLYGKMSEEEAFQRVKKYMHVDSSDFIDPSIPLLHQQRAKVAAEKPYNLVIILQESMGAEYVGALGGLQLTPYIDKLAEEGLLFTNLYCTGTRSVRGIEAVITGFLPSPSESVVKLSKSQTGFFTLAQLLKKSGYETSFIYGGMANFDNMGAFLNGNGFDEIIDQSVFDADGNEYALKSTWGYSDEDLLIKANQHLKSKGDKPFVSFIFSSSNHEPFEFPDGRIELYEQPKNTVHNAIKYADYAVGKFFELAKQEEYFNNTVFIIVADHNTRTYGKNLVPINKFRIPALILAPNIAKGTTYSKLCSQIDLPPTLLSIVGMDVETPMPGRNLEIFPDSIAGRAIMQFHDINAFRVDDQVVVMQPHKEPLQFQLLNDTTYIPTTLNIELAKDALAHVVAAGYLYKNRSYRLK